MHATLLTVCNYSISTLLNFSDPSSHVLLLCLGLCLLVALLFELTFSLVLLPLSGVLMCLTASCFFYSVLRVSLSWRGCNSFPVLYCFITWPYSHVCSSPVVQLNNAVRLLLQVPRWHSVSQLFVSSGVCTCEFLILCVAWMSVRTDHRGFNSPRKSSSLHPFYISMEPLWVWNKVTVTHFQQMVSWSSHRPDRRWSDSPVVQDSLQGAAPEISPRTLSAGYPWLINLVEKWEHIMNRTA